MKKILCSVVLSSLLFTGLSASEFLLDKPHTSVEFKVKHMLVSNTKGNFKNFDANIDFDEENKVFKVFNASVDVASLDTNNSKRDEHVKSADFLNMEKNPQLTFVMENYEKKSDDEGVMHGTLTINGVSKKVAFDVDITGVATFDGKTKLGFELELDLLRTDYNVAKETSDKIVGDKIEVKVFAEANKK
ncbi:YceI family protein [Campylobacter sp. MG1]|uniref:YceI family protein n=1 Tax=Campylobacter sp. MG1 TaxID=2976332 RepID=UPI00226CBFE4|nr:YceI family protein [Campylobacter sp. MG1]